MSPTLRIGGRALLLDPDGRVLLIHERTESGTHWLTPGGGVEAGEHPRRTAIRETFEETGIDIDLASDADPVLVTRRVWSWAGVVYDQTDHFFAAPVPAGLEVAPRRLTAIEQQTLLGHRWWTLAELRGTRETILPAQLADLLGGLSSVGDAGA